MRSGLLFDQNTMYFQTINTLDLVHFFTQTFLWHFFVHLWIIIFPPQSYQFLKYFIIFCYNFFFVIFHFLLLFFLINQQLYLIPLVDITCEITQRSFIRFFLIHIHIYFWSYFQLEFSIYFWIYPLLSKIKFLRKMIVL